MAGTPDRWEWLQSAYEYTNQLVFLIADLAPDEARELNPIMSTDGLLGSMWADQRLSGHSRHCPCLCKGCAKQADIMNKG